jgi:type I restriction-modification system DNA methylase subunit
VQSFKLSKVSKVFKVTTTAMPDGALKTLITFKTLSLLKIHPTFFAFPSNFATRTRKDQSFLVPVEEIREKDYDLSINKYKEVEREVITYDAPEVIMGRIAKLEGEINAAFEELRQMV